MKKIIKIGVVLIVLLTGFSKVSDAICYEVTIVCAGGGGTNSYVCGDTNEERLRDYHDLINAVCGEQNN